jgi:hypothetical protein
LVQAAGACGAGCIPESSGKPSRHSTLPVLQGWFSNREGKTPTGVFESDRTVEMITKLGNTSRAKAQSKYQALGANETAWKQKWFFRMYGSQAGQRFHEKQYNGGQGDFVDPVTVRVRAARQTASHPADPPRSVRATPRGRGRRPADSPRRPVREW